MSTELDCPWELPLTHPAVNCGPPQTGAMDDFLQPNDAPNSLVGGQITVALGEEWHGQLPRVIRHVRLPLDRERQGQEGPVDDHRLRPFDPAKSVLRDALEAHQG